MPNARLLTLLAATLVAASPLRAATDLDPLRTIAVQDGGRTKPLDTFARETARRVSGPKPFTGGESVAGLHSYGFGSGGYAWIGGFVAFEALALVIVAAFVRKHRAGPCPAVAVGVSSAFS
jgi:hypothetical protein